MASNNGYVPVKAGNAENNKIIPKEVAKQVSSSELIYSNAPADQERQPYTPSMLPRAAPRSVKPPPSYEQAVHARPVVRKRSNIQPVGETSNSSPSPPSTDSSSDDEHDQTESKLTSAYELRRRKLDEQQQTDVKELLYVNLGDTILKEPFLESCDPIASNDILPEEQRALLDTVKRLQEEQDLLRSKLKEHDDKLKSLLAKRTSLRQTLRVKKDSLIDVNKDTGPGMIQKGKQQSDYEETEHLYVQIEHLYTNFWRMHINNTQKPIRIMRQLQSESNEGRGAAARWTDDGYSEIGTVQDNMQLRKENEDLKQRIQDLQKQLSGPPIEPRPRVQDKSQTLTKTYSNGSPNNQQTAVLQGLRLNFNEMMTSPGSISPPIHPGRDSVSLKEITYEWCIFDYLRKYQAERFGQEEKIVSNPFYISHNGYRAQLEVYLNGSHFGQDKFMSLFLKVIKGSYDNQLKWPVDIKFIAKMVNQTDGRQRSIKGENEFNFTLPTGHSDDSCDRRGFIEFVSHNVISQRCYIRNDSILLEVKFVVV